MGSRIERSGEKNSTRQGKTLSPLLSRLVDGLVTTIPSSMPMNWQACLNHLVSGSPFQNTNLPPGYTYKPWTMAEVMQMSEKEQQTSDPGEWD